MSPKVSDQILERLRDWDVEYVFGYPGDGIKGLLAAWGRADNHPVFVQARHEEMAGPSPGPNTSSPRATGEPTCAATSPTTSTGPPSARWPNCCPSRTTGSPWLRLAAARAAAYRVG